MTTLADILAAHGTSPDTVSLTGPATRLGEELERWANEQSRPLRAGLENASAIASRLMRLLDEPCSRTDREEARDAVVELVGVVRKALR